MGEAKKRIACKCEECGIEISLYPSLYARSKNHFCSNQCANRFNNRIKNPSLMTEEVKAKLRRQRLEASAGRTYEKHNQRHLHRIVAEQKLGRPLRRGEVVHHIDGNKRNNTPENLIVFANQGEHAKHHQDLKRHKVVVSV